jgi:hypothetical protein
MAATKTESGAQRARHLMAACAIDVRDELKRDDAYLREEVRGWSWYLFYYYNNPFTYLLAQVASGRRAGLELEEVSG